MLVGVLGASNAVGTNYANSSSSGNTDSQRATDLLKRNFSAQSGDTDQIVFKATNGKLTDRESGHKSRRCWRRWLPFHT